MKHAKKRVRIKSAPVFCHILSNGSWHLLRVYTEVLFVEKSSLREYHTISSCPPNRPPATIYVLIFTTLLDKKLKKIKLCCLQTRKKR